MTAVRLREVIREEVVKFFESPLFEEFLFSHFNTWNEAGGETVE